MITVSNKIIGIILAIVFLAAILLIPYGIDETNNTGDSSRLFPYIIFGTCLALSIAFIFTEKEKKYQIDLSVYKVLITFALYYVALIYLGFIISTALFVVGSSRIWRIKRIKLVIVLAVIVPVVFYVIFTVLMKIELPQGQLVKLLFN